MVIYYKSLVNDVKHIYKQIQEQNSEDKLLLDFYQFDSLDRDGI